MKKRFKNFIEEHNLVPPQSRLLLAVSGGVDSMVMLHLFHMCGYSFSVAHCNFSLRGAESDADEQLVRDTCNAIGSELHVNRFCTAQYAQEEGLTIQVAARNLRYNWFNQLISELGYSSVAVAHNKNDVAETMLINLCRGTGLKGLTGIKPHANNTIRPLLFALRKEIEAFAEEKGIMYRNDSTNSQTKYVRNRIRHNVIPELQKVNQGLIDNLYSTAHYLSSTWQAIDSMNADFRRKVITEKDAEVHYSIRLLKGYSFRQLFLVEELVGYGFPASMALDVEKSLFSQSGKQFHSATHTLLRDRESLVIIPKLEVQAKAVSIQCDTAIVESPLRLNFSTVDVDESFAFSRERNVGTFDLSKLHFPLVLRPWCEGDWFTPFGMQGRKKVSDYLVDTKVPLHLKGTVYVLESNGDVVWVVGHRTDNRFRVDSSTTKALVVELLD